MNDVWTPESLAALAGVLVSLLFSYLPGFQGWYQGLDGTAKRLVMLAALAAVSAGCLGLACSGWGADIFSDAACDRAGAVGLAKGFLAALVANQAAFAISPARGGAADEAASHGTAGG